jgi:hypothetical protein
MGAAATAAAAARPVDRAEALEVKRFLMASIILTGRNRDDASTCGTK